MQTKPMQTDVVIIGGGMAGLTTACYLAKAGVAVTLYEKAAHLGGRASTQLHEGYLFNRGIHALYSGGATSEVLQELNITYTYGVPRTTFVLLDGRFYRFPSEPLALLRRSWLSVRDRAELARVFLTLPRLKAAELTGVTVQAWLEQTIHRPTVRQMFVALARTFVYSAALDLVSAEVFIEKLQRALKHPIQYVDGGWQTLVDALRQVAERAGAQLVSGTTVDSVVYQDGEVQGVRLGDGRVVPASAVVIATTPQEAAKLLDDGPVQELRQVIDALVPMRVASLDVALSRLPSARYPVVQDQKHPLFLSVQSLSSRLAPAGGALITAFKPLHPAHPTDPREDERELELFLDIAQPGWRDVLVKRVYLPRILATGALPAASTGGFAGRPASQVAGVSHLYLAGDWVGPVGFLNDAALASARQVAQTLLHQRRLRPEAIALASR